MSKSAVDELADDLGTDPELVEAAINEAIERRELRSLQKATSGTFQ